MKRHAALWAGIVAVLFGVLFYANIPSLLFTMFIIGIIPGTTSTVPPWVMLLVYPPLFIGILYWLTTQTLLIGELTSTKQPSRRAKTSATTAVRKQRQKTTSATKRRARVTA